MTSWKEIEREQPTLTALTKLASSPLLTRKLKNHHRRGGNGKAEFIKKAEDVADGDACAKLCSETGGCQHYK